MGVGGGKNIDSLTMDVQHTGVNLQFQNKIGLIIPAALLTHDTPNKTSHNGPFLVNVGKCSSECSHIQVEITFHR